MDTSHPSELLSNSGVPYPYFATPNWDSGCNLNNYSPSTFHPRSSSGDYELRSGGGGGSAAVGSHVVNTSSSSRTARSSLSEMDSVSEAEENNKLLMEEEEEEGGGGGGGDNNGEGSLDNTAPEATRLLQRGSSTGSAGSNLNISGEKVVGQDSIHRQAAHHIHQQHHQTAAEILNKREAQAYHFKRKYNFRSDSVFSDVTPMPTSSNNQDTSNPPETREKSGSLSSLKGQTSKWASLRKKLGRLNSSSAAADKKESRALEQHAHQLQQHYKQQQDKPPGNSTPTKPAKTPLEEKRSLLQRAKTLAILPVRGTKEEVVKKPKEISKPPELFNVGGEMNMIPLELLIDINDLKIQQ